MSVNRREFLGAAAAACCLRAQEPAKTRLGLVRSSHNRLPRPVPPDHPLDADLVRDMVWKAIEYGSPAAGSLEAKIRPGSWVVVKPNIGGLRAAESWRPGDTTDFRVTRAVVEYLARKSGAKRITVAEGGTYRGLHDKAEDHVVTQNGRRVDANLFDWGSTDFPGFSGSLAGMLADFAARFPGKRFDYVDLSYDAVRDASGAFRKLPVPRSRNGVGAASNLSEYFVTNTIVNCDFLITVPVMKMHLQCGMTCCLKNYVGTGPREVYSVPGTFSNLKLHRDYSVGGRIDTFIADLAAFHPPDYCVIDGLRGLQEQEHSNHRDDQMIRSNLIVAGEDPVAADSLAATLIGHNPWDIDYLHHAARREMGTMDFRRIEVVGEEADRLRRPWEKPRNWFGRCNREWVTTLDLSAPAGAWKPHFSRVDALDLVEVAGASPKYAAAAVFRAEGGRKGYLWIGARGKVAVSLNGETVLREEAITKHRIGQYQVPVSLTAGENRVVFQVEPADGAATVSLLVTGPRNNGDTLEGLRWVPTRG